MFSRKCQFSRKFSRKNIYFLKFSKGNFGQKFVVPWSLVSRSKLTSLQQENEVATGTEGGDEFAEKMEYSTPAPDSFFEK
jgi:hypothetical protein